LKPAPSQSPKRSTPRAALRLTETVFVGSLSSFDGDGWLSFDSVEFLDLAWWPVGVVLSLGGAALFAVVFLVSVSGLGGAAAVYHATGTGLMAATLLGTLGPTP
jgi:hypothetical protein